MSDGAEKRAHPRIAIETEVELSVGDGRYTLHAGNVSIGGVFLKGDLEHLPELEIGKNVGLRFGSQTEKVECQAQVRWVDSGAIQGRVAGFGLSFVKLDVPNMLRLTKLIKS
jgi:hypothetical protein